METNQKSMFPENDGNEYRPPWASGPFRRILAAMSFPVIAALLVALLTLVLLPLLGQ